MGTQSAIRKPAAFLTGIGLLTFLMPFLTTDAPVNGRTEWAPLNMLNARADLWRPAPPPFQNHAVLYEVAFVYVLMVIALVVLAVPWSQKPLKYIALVGAATSVSLLKTAPRGFGWVFYGKYTHARMWDGDNSLRGMLGWQGIRFNLAFFVFLAVMPLLLIVIIKSGRQPLGRASGTDDTV